MSESTLIGILVACMIFIASAFLFSDAGWKDAQYNIANDCDKAGVFIYKHQAYECHKK